MLLVAMLFVTLVVFVPAVRLLVEVLEVPFAEVIGTAMD